MKEYRSLCRASDLVSFRVKVRQSDLLIHASKDFSEKVQNILLELYRDLEGYIEAHPEFLKSFVPVAVGEDASCIVRKMSEASYFANVGPMASVAGAVAQFVGESLLEESEEVIVENGGDIFMSTRKSRIIGIYAGDSIYSMRIGVRLDRGTWGIGTSSATVGHSYSFGRADAAVVVCDDAAVSDAFATALCNRVGDKKDIEPALKWIKEKKEKVYKNIMGAIVIVGDAMGAWGDLEVVRL